MTGTAPSGRRRATSAATGLPVPTQPSEPPEVREPTTAPGRPAASASTDPPRCPDAPAEDPLPSDRHTSGPSERLAALLAEHPPPGNPEPPERSSGSGPAHRWEVATRTRVPRSFLFLALTGLAVLAWVLFDPGLPPGAGQQRESGAEDVLAEVEVPTEPEVPAATGVPISPGPAPAPPSAVHSAGPTVLVHVTGEVAEPGVVELDPGARVLDAVEAAGGLTDAAVTGTVNLAAPVTDGQQVLVPDAETAQAAPLEPGGGGAAPAEAGAGDGSAPLNLNTATAADLEVLPRVGPVLAQRIVEFRDAQGGFTAVDHLDAVPGIGPVLMETLAPLVTV